MLVKGLQALAANLSETVLADLQEYPPCAIPDQEEPPKFNQAISPFNMAFDHTIPTAFIPPCDCNCCVALTGCSPSDPVLCTTRRTDKCKRWSDSNFVPLVCNVEKQWIAFDKQPPGRTEMAHTKFCREFCTPYADIPGSMCPENALPQADLGPCPCTQKVMLVKSATGDPLKEREAMTNVMKDDFTLTKTIIVDGITLPAGAQLDVSKLSAHNITIVNDLMALPADTQLEFKLPIPGLLLQKAGGTRGFQASTKCCSK
mmetsp:Transcript_21355/g.54566  ORF Transcript_21355/g.54566 Transcript_21355/m.54566 type:complete len:259 (-) Transcript_21355:44-820(-)